MTTFSVTDTTVLASNLTPTILNLPSTSAGYGSTTLPRAVIASSTLARFPIPIGPNWTKQEEAWTPLTNPSATVYLGLYGVYGTTSPYLGTYDMGGVGATSLAGRTQFQIPWNYVSASTFNLIFSAGMITTVASVSATLVAEVMKYDEDTTVSADLATTLAQDINSLTFSDITLAVNPTTLVAGDWLDIRLTMAINDAGDAGPMFGAVAAASAVMTVR